MPYIRLFLAASFNTKAQDSLPVFLKKIQRSIESSVPADAERFQEKERKSQYYILDIHLDSTGSIGRLDYFGKANLGSSVYLDKAVSKICKAKWKVKTKIQRIIVPIFITFSADHAIYDLSFLLEGKGNVPSDPETLITKNVIIAVFDPVRKSSPSKVNR